MNNNNIQSLLNKAQEVLNSSEDYNGFKMQYALINKEDWRKSEVLADDYDRAVLITPYKNKDRIQNVPEWDFSFDEYIFERIESKYDIGYISIDTHYGIWCSLEELYPEDIEHKKGVNNYLKHCDKYEVTKEKIDKELKLDVPNAMKFYEKKVNNREER